MNEKLFDPSRMPARDEYGMCWHPDLEQFLVNHEGRPCEDNDEGYIKPEHLSDAGWDTRIVPFEYDAEQFIMRRYEEADSPDISYWEPTKPKGEGWQLIAVYDTEDMPVALFVREKIP